MINWTDWKNLTIEQFAGMVLEQEGLDIPVKVNEEGGNDISFIDGLTEEDGQWVVEEDPYLRVPPVTMATFLKIERSYPASKAPMAVVNEMIAYRMPEKAVKKSRLKPDQLLMLFTVLHEIGLYLDFKATPLDEYIQKGLARFDYMDALDAKCRAMPLNVGQKIYAKEYRKDPLEAAGDAYATKAMKAYLRTF